MQKSGRAFLFLYCADILSRGFLFNFFAILLNDQTVHADGSNAVDCASCTADVKSDGSPCECYTASLSDFAYCGKGGCDVNGMCGSMTCAAETDRTPGVADGVQPSGVLPQNVGLLLACAFVFAAHLVL